MRHVGRYSVTFQIRAIHLFNHAGDRRTLPFKLNALNIITGNSKTGKTSVIDIIDYCLGSSKYNVAAGVIRDTVNCFALELETPNGVLMVARAAPGKNKSIQTQMHLSYRGRDSKPPELIDLLPNSDVDAGVHFLSRILGIDENITDKGSGTREEFDVTIQHALFFCIQGQDEIANRAMLFHKQNQEFHPQAIRDVLPYFLGAVDPKYLYKRQRLSHYLRELQLLERKQADNQALSKVSGRASALLHEAILVGLAEPQETTTDIDILKALTTALHFETNKASEIDPSERISSLLEVRETLRLQYSEKRAETRRLKKLIKYGGDFAGEAGEGYGRLQSLNLLNADPSSESHADVCPVCNSQLGDPFTTAKDILDQLHHVAMEIAEVGQELPRLQTSLNVAENDLALITEQLDINRDETTRLSESLELFDSLKETALQRAAIRGRIALYLDSVSEQTESSFKHGRLEELRLTIIQLRMEIDSEAVGDRLEAGLSRVSYSMSQVASDLKLEHSPAPVRLDIKNLTVVVDTSGGSYRLKEIGSGENWLGYHLATHIGLHNYFTEHNRPLPRFLILDQPSQVYYPPDPRGDEILEDDDRKAVSRIFSCLLAFIEGSEGGFQILVLEHADLEDEFFQNAIVEKWRGDGKALIPTSWLKGNI